VPPAPSRGTLKTRKETMSAIWRSLVLKPKSATLSGQRTTTSMPNIISDRCAQTQKGRKRSCCDGPARGGSVDRGGRDWRGFLTLKKISWPAFCAQAVPSVPPTLPASMIASLILQSSYYRWSRLLLRHSGTHKAICRALIRWECSMIVINIDSIMVGAILSEPHQR
jgi:hypothetical protein